MTRSDEWNARHAIRANDTRRRPPETCSSSKSNGRSTLCAAAATDASRPLPAKNWVNSWRNKFLVRMLTTQQQIRRRLDKSIACCDDFTEDLRNLRSSGAQSVQLSPTSFPSRERNKINKLLCLQCFSS